MSDLSREIGGQHGCAEHMADKRGRYNDCHLIERTHARVVAHWRHPAIDVGYPNGGYAESDTRACTSSPT